MNILLNVQYRNLEEKMREKNSVEDFKKICLGQI